MIETTIGLPNTCSICGQPAGQTWFAECEDYARAGGGMHEGCVPGKREAQQVTPPEVKDAVVDVVFNAAPLSDALVAHTKRQRKAKS